MYGIFTYIWFTLFLNCHPFPSLSFWVGPSPLQTIAPWPGKVSQSRQEKTKKSFILTWLSGWWKNISQIGSFPQVGVKTKNVWNHHLVIILISCWYDLRCCFDVIWCCLILLSCSFCCWFNMDVRNKLNKKKHWRLGNGRWSSDTF